MTVPQVAPERGAVIAEPKTPVKPTPPQPATPPLMLPDGRRVRVVHIVAELAPFARSGGLGEAVNSLARFQAASGQWTAIVMPLYDTARRTVPQMEPVGPEFQVSVGPRSETVRLWRLVSAPDDPLA